ncbi:MAG: ABC transporter ATP-binding protein [Pseudolabrys sp.]|nr:ABC transporter ATP-binding protein [Pseudolabrys sp.]
MASVDLEHVDVLFPIYEARSRSLKNRLVQTVGGNVGQSADHVVIEALKDVTLHIKPGERVGLVGHNGAGKSTLLRVIAGIYEPPRGRVNISGKVASLLDLTMGMDFEASGYENIMLRATMMGMSYAESKSIVPYIESFSGLGEYLHLPMRTYSSGMQLRLAFSISTAQNPEIILMDELLTVGDSDFMKKAEARITEMIQDADILVLASHVPEVINRFCNVIVTMEGGRILDVKKNAA